MNIPSPHTTTLTSVPLLMDAAGAVSETRTKADTIDLTGAEVSFFDSNSPAPEPSSEASISFSHEKTELPGINDSSKTNKVIVRDCGRRDGLQSTSAVANMTYNLADSAEVSLGASLAGFDSEESLGGNSIEAAMQHGINNIRLNNQTKEIVGRALKEEDKAEQQTFTTSLFRSQCVYSRRSFDREFVEANWRLTIEKGGVGLIRLFNGLDDIDSFILTRDMLDVAEKHNVNIQGAIATGPTLEQIEGVLPRDVYNDFIGRLDSEQFKVYSNMHSKEHYINYAKLLVLKGVDSLVIKDLCGRFDETDVVEFIQDLKDAIVALQKEAEDNGFEGIYANVKKHYIPVGIHHHSTNEAKAKRTMNAAKPVADSMDFVCGPLKGRAGHLGIEAVASFDDPDDRIKVKRDEAYDNYLAILQRVYGKAGKKRTDYFVDDDTTREILEMIEGLHGAGGAVNFITKGAKYITPGMKESDDVDVNNVEGFRHSLDNLLHYMAWLMLMMGMPPNVTPVPDAITMQARENLKLKIGIEGTQYLGTDDIYNIETISSMFSEGMVQFLRNYFGTLKTYVSDPSVAGGVRAVEVKPPFDLRSLMEKRVAMERRSYEDRLKQSIVDKYDKERKQLKEDNEDGVLTDAQKVDINQRQAAEIKARLASIKPDDVYSHTLKASIEYPDTLKGRSVLEAYEQDGVDHLGEARSKAEALIGEHGVKALSFANEHELGLLALQGKVFDNRLSIDTAIDEHAKRVETLYDEFSKNTKYKEAAELMAIIPNIKYLMMPFFDYFKALVRVGVYTSRKSFLNMKISEFGETAKDQKAIYQGILNLLGNLASGFQEGEHFNSWQELQKRYEGYTVGRLLSDIYKVLRIDELLEAEASLDKPKHKLRLGLFPMKARRLADVPDKVSQENITIFRELHKSLAA